MWVPWVSRARRGRVPELRAERQEQAELRRQQWERTSRSFARAAACCSRQARWGEPRTATCGAAAERRERRERLEERRERLRRLLRHERDTLEKELRDGVRSEELRDGVRSEELRDGVRNEVRDGVRSGVRSRMRSEKPRDGMRSGVRSGMRSEEPRDSRWEQRMQVAEPLLREHWKENTAEVREVESELHKNHVREAWGDQPTQKPKEGATELKEKKCYENEYEMVQREELERMRQEEEKHQLEKRNQVEMLLQQIEELKLQETETKKLKKEKENLLKQQWELENLEEERKQMEEHRRKKDFSRFLRHQCGAQLKRRAQQVQEELEIDRQILSALLEREEDQLWRAVPQEQAGADVAWMKRVIEEQLQLEKEREAELETLFTEEAKKVWEKMEEEWEREKVARDRLMNEVFAGRQRQIQEKMRLNRRAQEETMKYREQLIRELEETKERRRQDQRQELKRAQRQELEAQVTEEEEEKEKRWAWQRHEELMQQEGEHRVCSYLKAPWT